MDKKGDYKYGLLLTLIMGVLVVGLSFYFIFNELFSQEDIDYEVCRQSIIARSVLPDVTLDKIATFESFKDSYPLKCKTRVVEVDLNDVKNVELAQRKIGNAMMECWALFDKGDATAFPGKFLKTSSCVPCVRVSLSDEAKEYMREENVKIDIREGLDLKVKGKEFSYYNWLKNSGEKFSAFDFGNGFSFNLDGEKFVLNDADWIWKTFELQNKKAGTFSALMSVESVDLPRSFNAEDGDLLISYGVVDMGDSEVDDYVPYLFYFQVGQEDVFEEVREDFVFDIKGTVWAALSSFSILSAFDLPSDKLKNLEKDSAVPFCKEWEGVPV